MLMQLGPSCTHYKKNYKERVKMNHNGPKRFLVDGKKSWYMDGLKNFAAPKHFDKKIMRRRKQQKKANCRQAVAEAVPDSGSVKVRIVLNLFEDGDEDTSGPIKVKVKVKTSFN